MPIAKDLAFRLFGHSFGTWFWVANSQSVHPVKLIRWNPAQGTHPFVLVADYDGGPAATVRPRSKSSKNGIKHHAHPPDCSPSCKIRDEGRIVPLLWSLGPGAICAENYSCQEPYEEILEKLRNGAAQ
jgi:hypothetical protein